MRCRFVLISLLIVLVSCANDELEYMSNEYAQFESKPIEISRELVCFKAGDICNNWSLEDLPHLILFYDPMQCASCKLHGLVAYAELYESDMYGKIYDIIPIFAPSPDSVPDLLEEASMVLHDYPIYIDTSGRFVTDNSHLPNDRRFHAFLTDPSGKVVFVGNPISSRKLNRLFRRALSKYLK